LVSRPPTPQFRPTLRLEWVTPESLAENPKNWRRHPDLQRAALGASLDECGWAGALLFNETTGRLVDGHARRDEALRKGIPAVPVLVGAWPEATEHKLLATLDPISSLAETDAAQLAALLKDVETGSDALATLLAQLAEEATAAAAEPPPAPPPEPVPPPGGAPPPPAAAFWLRVGCPTAERRTDLMAALRAEGYDCSPA
jgi:hypothetical protein